MKIRKAVETDAAAIREIALAAKIDAWSEADYQAEIGRPGSYVLIAAELAFILGFLLARTVPGRSKKRDVDLYNIAVRPEFSRQGVGSALIAELLKQIGLKHVENIWLEVRESNISAIRFYEKHGFAAELTRPHFYADPVENAVIMRLRIDPAEDVNSM